MLLKERNLIGVVANLVDIVEFIRLYTELIPSGDIRYKGKCPLCNSSDNALTVSPEKNSFYCFGCHSSGDAVAFGAAYHQVSPKQAARNLLNMVMAELEVKEFKQIFEPIDAIDLNKIDINELGQSDLSFIIARDNVLSLILEWAHENSGKLSYEHQVQFRKLDISHGTRWGYFPSEFHEAGSVDGLLGIFTANAYPLLKRLRVILENNKSGEFYSALEGRILYPIIQERKDGHGPFVIAIEGHAFEEGDDRGPFTTACCVSQGTLKQED